MKVRHGLAVIIGSVVGAVLAGPVWGQDEAFFDTVERAVYSETEYTDNAFDTSDDKEDEVEQIIGLDVALQRATRSMTLDVAYDINRREYLEDNFEGRTVLEGYGALLLGNLQDRFSWLIEHQQRFLQRDSTGTDNPDNRDERSIFITGPNVYLRLSPVDSLNGSLRYIETTFDDADESDSERIVADLRLLHQLNMLTSVYLFGSYADVDIDADSGDYERSIVALGVDREYRQGNISLAAGQTDLDRDVGDDVDGFFGRAIIRYTTSLHNFQFFYNHEITDSSIGLSLSGADYEEFDDGDSNFDDTDIVTRTRYQVYYERIPKPGGLGVAVRLFSDEEDYEDQPRDQESVSARVYLRYPLSNNLESQLVLKYEETDFLDQPALGEDEDYSAAFTLSHELTRVLWLRYRIGYEERENDVDASRDYESMIAYLGITYAF